MNEIMFNIKMLVAKMNTTVVGLAEMADINPVHLQNVCMGRTKLTARDITQLSKVTGIPCENITAM